ncbi:flagellar motor protein [Iningainema tapete]|uniref:Flagellar motor protein n=1 Tax=Iningainema tapete BLCC-T55 TaxID=2748662 RepID=A0A8J6XFA4_9CYAN|nr:flagellar motor protein [Iningainema tapete]MBD2774594.1 flagellar motor protein [Iningainema tapete BLCC-T55]
MPRRTKNASPPETFSIWTSYTDLMSNAFMVLSLLLLLTIAKAASNNQNQKPRFPDEKAQKIIVLPAAQYNFDSGSAVLPNNLKDAISQNGADGPILKAIVKNIEEIENSDKRVDLIEVIGHTDGQEVGSLRCNTQKGSNLDDKLEEVATRNQDVGILCPGSNADLGLMRALAVVKELQKIQSQKKQGRFKQLGFRAYSAAQLHLPNNGGFAQVDRTNNAKRRRIEIRFAQFGQETTPE